MRARAHKHEESPLAHLERSRRARPPSQAITASGGAWASVTSRQMVRAPAFTFDNVRSAATFLKWFRASGVEAEIRAAISAQPHCALVRLEAKITDRTVHVHVGIDSEDAAGQNMVT